MVVQFKEGGESIYIYKVAKSLRKEFDDEGSCLEKEKCFSSRGCS